VTIILPATLLEVGKFDDNFAAPARVGIFEIG
jgi:hypothetical protein